jgi:hypothetical protein
VLTAWLHCGYLRRCVGVAQNRGSLTGNVANEAKQDHSYKQLCRIRLALLPLSVVLIALAVWVNYKLRHCKISVRNDAGSSLTFLLSRLSEDKNLYSKGMERT